MNVPIRLVGNKGMNSPPIMFFNFSIAPIGKFYERSVYSMTDLLGNVGGILGILQGLAAALVSIICRTNIDT